MRHLILVFGFLLFTSLSSQAEIIELVCADESGTSYNYTIDTTRNEVFSRKNWKARNVSIDEGTISFTLDTDGYQFLHIINRSTGNMTIQDQDQNKNKTLWPSFKCEKAKPKF